MTNIQIRSSSPEDDKAIVTIQISGWKTAYKGIIADDYLSSISFEKRLHGRRECFKQKDTYSIVAVIDDKIIGMCSFGVSRYQKHGMGEIYALYVDTTYQRKNIGRSLMEEAYSRLNDKKLIPVVLLVLKDNEPARKFYENCSYQAIDEIETKIGDHMYKEIIYKKGK